jgi:hypothetical protein
MYPDVMSKAKLRQLAKIISELFGEDKEIVIRKSKDGKLHFYGHSKNT